MRGQAGGSGAFLWLFQRVSGLAILVMLSVHIWVNHYSPGGFTTYDKMALRLANPVWKAFDLTFLVLLLFHGFNGIWTVVVDYASRDWVRLGLLGLLWVLGLALFFLGAISIIPFEVKA